MQPNQFHYVYTLGNKDTPPRHYAGLTQDLKTRLQHHNSGQCRHTTKHRPWHLETAVAFHSRDKAAAFEKYLKTGSGRAFAKKHF